MTETLVWSDVIRALCLVEFACKYVPNNPEPKIADIKIIYICICAICDKRLVLIQGHRNGQLGYFKVCSYLKVLFFPPADFIVQILNDSGKSEEQSLIWNILLEARSLLHVRCVSEYFK